MVGLSFYHTNTNFIRIFQKFISVKGEDIFNVAHHDSSRAGYKHITDRRLPLNALYVKVTHIEFGFSYIAVALFDKICELVGN